jgi:hypothetical protein
LDFLSGATNGFHEIEYLKKLASGMVEEVAEGGRGEKDKGKREVRGTRVKREKGDEGQRRG